MEELLVTGVVLIFPFASAGFIAWSHANWKGALIGALTLWLFLFLGLVLLAGRYSEGGPGGAMVVLWMVSGWLFSGFFCVSVAGLRKRMLRTSQS